MMRPQIIVNEKVINYIDKSYNNIIIDLNLENSGNVFSQWKKAFQKQRDDIFG